MRVIGVHEPVVPPIDYNLYIIPVLIGFCLFCFWYIWKHPNGSVIVPTEKSKHRLVNWNYYIKRLINRDQKKTL